MTVIPRRIDVIRQLRQEAARVSQAELEVIARLGYEISQVEQSIASAHAASQQATQAAANANTAAASASASATAAQDRAVSAQGVADSAIATAGTATSAADNANTAAGNAHTAANAVQNRLAEIEQTDLWQVNASSAQPVGSFGDGALGAPDMSITQDFGGDPILVFFTATFEGLSDVDVSCAPHANGVINNYGRRSRFLSAGEQDTVEVITYYHFGVGMVTVDVRGNADPYLEADVLSRQMSIFRIGA